MHVPVSAKITLLIVLAIGIGTGATVFGLTISKTGPGDEPATFIAAGSAILAASVAALIAQLAGAFKNIED